MSPDGTIAVGEYFSGNDYSTILPRPEATPLFAHAAICMGGMCIIFGQKMGGIAYRKLVNWSPGLSEGALNPDANLAIL